MPRLTSEQIDDEILDVAATLFARHGFEHVSVQRVADAVGYSKTGLLHRFPSKDALQEAVLDRCVREMAGVGAAVAHLAAGPERDRAAIVELVALTARRPGTVALMLSRIGMLGGEGAVPALDAIAEAAFGAFAADPDDLPRAVRVIGALGALAVGSVACADLTVPDAGPLLVAVAYDALGHRSPEDV